MNKENFDEMQILNRQRIAYQTMFFTFIVLLANGIVKNYIVDEWAASPIVETNVLITIPVIYFVSMCIWKNAYFSQTGVYTNIVMIFFMIAGLFNIYTFVFKMDAIIQGKEYNIPIIGLFFTLTSVQYYIKKIIDKRKYNKED